MLAYWFSLTPPLLATPHVRVWFALAIACVVGAVVLRVRVIRRIPHSFLRRPLTRAARLLTVNSLTLAVLLFFRSEGIPFLSARFWLVLLVLGDVAWAIAIARHVLVRLPKERTTWEAEEVKQKYLH